ncbi:MFS transporter [Dactylosporangium sp. NPDC050688]|uniref:MFS transporter n=1 Tax=Dactylosporangium sp. NPDC050688 TaxID=3157217 RepID=UPI0033CF1872
MSRSVRMSKSGKADRAPLPRRFTRFWLATAVSGFGDGLRLTALPLLAAYSSGGDPAAVAYVTAAGSLPWLLFGLGAGLVVDRTDRRRLMWAVDSVRALFTAGFAAMVFLGAQHVALLCALAFAVGTGHTLFSSASAAYLPSVVGPDGLDRANGRLMSVQVLTMQLVGPAAAGFLFAVAHGLPFALDGVSFAASAVLILAMGAATGSATGSAAGPASQGTGRPRVSGGEVLAGLRWTFGHPAIRAQSTILLIINVLSGMVLAVFVVYATGPLGLGSRGYGMLMALLAVGAMVGALAAPMLRARLSDRATLMMSALLVGGVLILLGAVAAVWAAAVSVLLFGLASMLWNVVTVSIRQRVVPDAVLGRASAAVRMLSAGAVPLGALIAAVAVGPVGLRPLFVIAGCVVLAATVLLARDLGRPLPQRPTGDAEAAGAASPDRLEESSGRP